MDQISTILIIFKEVLEHVINKEGAQGVNITGVPHIIFQVGQNAETEKLAFKKLEECLSKPVLFSGRISNCCLGISFQLMEHLVNH